MKHPADWHRFLRERHPLILEWCEGLLIAFGLLGAGALWIMKGLK